MESLVRAGVDEGENERVSFWWILLSPVLVYKLIERRNIHLGIAGSSGSFSNRNPLQWVLISFASLGVGLLFVFYFLNEDFRRHEREVAATAAARRSAPLQSPWKSFWTRFVLTVVTLGAFGVIWIYMLTKEPEAHGTWEKQALGHA